MNPQAIAFYWTFSILMAGAIALSPVAVYVVGGLLIAYHIYAAIIA